MSGKKILYVILSLILLLNFPLEVSAKTIAEIKAEQEETKRQLEEANSNLSNLQSEKDNIDDEIKSLDEQIVEVLAAVSMVEDEIVEIEGLIEEAQAELDVAIAEEERQYTAMKARIKFMYEKGDYTYVQLLLESKSLSDLVNKTEYIEKLYEYDRKMLLKYQEARQAVADAKAKLEEQQEELEVSKHELEDEKSSLDEMLEEKKAEASDYDTQISRAKQEAAAYKAKIKQQNAEIKKLEEAEAAKRRAAEEAAKKSSSSGSVDASSVINSSGGSASGKEIASFACKYVGNPYVAGGTSLTSGCDCSGFTWAVYQNFGYSLPRSSTAQRSAGRGVSYSEAQPGDIICYAGHVALYIGGGRIVHASTPSTGIKYGVATYKEILGVRRIVG
ncbi:NlpC/P60 family protein [Bacteroides heparinolyticus]|uniref:C40 family peptidase n=1 Tax=Prevotella heparinolytica TaxID=28113 RepID=UPI00359FAA45